MSGINVGICIPRFSFPDGNMYVPRNRIQGSAEKREEARRTELRNLWFLEWCYSGVTVVLQWC
jgi:hypothetical protein